MDREQIGGEYNRAHNAARTGLAVLATMLVTVVVAGCSSGTPDSAARVDSAVSATPPALAAPDPVPTAVAGLGHHAENAFDMAKAADWAKARASTDSLRAAVGMLPDTGVAATPDAGRLRSEVMTATAALDRAVTARDATVAQREANRLTELGARLASPYGPRVPAGVTLLDFYGRELELGAAQATGSGAEKLLETAAAVRRTWDEVRPQVLARGGTAEAASFDSLVTRLSAARVPADYARLATPVLDQVDHLERVFTR